MSVDYISKANEMLEIFKNTIFLLIGFLKMNRRILLFFLPYLMILWKYNQLMKEKNCLLNPFTNYLHRKFKNS